MKTVKILLCVLVVAWLVPSFVLAQEVVQQGAVQEVVPDEQGRGRDLLERYDEYYDGDKFNSLSGGDGILTQEDWQNNRNSKEADIFGGFRWEEAVKFDADGDGALDKHEAAAYKAAEKKALIENKEFLPYLYEDKEWLKDHPKVAEKLFDNRKWLDEHPRVAEEMADDAGWLKNHPEAAKKLYEDNEFLRNHPKFTKDAHDFFESHPELREKAAARPEMVEEAVKVGAKYPKAAKALEEKAKAHPEETKKIMKAADKHPGKAKKAAKHPAKAKEKYRQRKGK